MTVVHRSGVKHGNADGMSRIPDDVQFCDCYKAGSEPETLPCGGCKYCTRAHNQWSRFEEDVEYVVPLAVNTITDSNSNSVWLEGYSKNSCIKHSIQTDVYRKLSIGLLQRSRQNKKSLH